MKPTRPNLDTRIRFPTPRTINTQGTGQPGMTNALFFPRIRLKETRSAKSPQTPCLAPRRLRDCPPLATITS